MICYFIWITGFLFTVGYLETKTIKRFRDQLLVLLLWPLILGGAVSGQFEEEADDE